MSGGVPEHLIPPDEESRVTALHNLHILDTGREHRFDGLVAELAEKLGVPIAYLALISEDRQWIKSKVGSIPTEARREDAFCSYTILGDEPVLVADAAKDPRFSGGPLVRDSPHLRFYAGIPIADKSGHNVGTVCVAGPTPREITPRDVAILEGFADRLQRELNRQPTVLLAYASEDEETVGRLLATDPRLNDPTVLDLWSSRRAAHEVTGVRLKDALWQAKSVTLMISPAFLRSVFVEQESLRWLLKARQLDPFPVRAVLVEPCDRGAVDWLAAQDPWPANNQAITLGSAAETDSLLRDLAIEILGAPPAAAAQADAAAAPAPRQQDVQLFLSHAGEDAAAVKDLAGRLRQAGVNVWLDVDELRPGDDWMQALEDALDSSDVFAVYIGRSGIARWIGREVRVALDRNAKDPRFRFIPILGPGAEPDALPRFVAQHHWLDLREGDPQPAEIRSLVASILRRPAEAVSLLPPGEPPFRGLLTFGAEHAHLFFGRDQETAQLLERLRTSPFLAIIGDSGSGKSSLVRAGLVPALHRGHFRDAGSISPTWRVAVITPGSNPFRALAGGLVDLLPEASPVERMATLQACSKQLAGGTGGLCDALAALVPKGDRTLLVIDQFEEVFTQCQDPDERDRFIDTLLAGSHCHGDRPLHTVVTLRADFYSQCFEHPTLPQVLSTNQYAVRAIAHDKLVEVIEKPALLAGIKLEPGLIEAILFDLGDGPGNLPLLEHTLLQLWKLRVGETLTHSSYEEIGRVQGALEHHAEEVYGRFAEGEKKAACALLLGLVVATENAGPARRRARIAEVLPAGENRAAAEEVLCRLVAERLLMVRGSVHDGDAGGGDNNQRGRDDNEVEVAHEALLRGWQRLHDWLREDREFLLWRQRTRAAFDAWEGSDRDAGALLRGVPLAEARRWIELRPNDLSEDGRTFIRESVDRDKRARRWKKTALATMVVLFVAAVIFGLIAWASKDQAQQNFDVASLALQQVGEITEVTGQARAEQPEAVELKREIAQRAIGFYETVNRGSFATPLQLEEAVARYRLGNLLTAQGQRGAGVAAFAAYDDAVDMLQGLSRRSPDDPDYSRELANAHYWRAEAHRKSGNPVAAGADYDRALKAQRPLAAEASAGAPRHRRLFELGRTLNGLGIALRRQELFADAEKTYLEARGSFEAALAALGPDPRDSEHRYRQGLAWALTNLGELYEGWGQQHEVLSEPQDARARFEEARRSYEEAIATLEDLGPGDRQVQLELAVNFNNLANLLARIELDAAASAANDRAVALMEELAAPLPEIRNELGNIYLSRGELAWLTGRDDEAERTFRRAREIYDGLTRGPADEAPPEYRKRRAMALARLADLGSDEATAELCRLLPELTAGERQAYVKYCRPFEPRDTQGDRP